VTPDTIITCVDCGGRAHLLTTWPDDDPPQAGDVMTYHCEDCWERLDLVLPDATRIHNAGIVPARARREGASQEVRAVRRFSGSAQR
jgi:hypothetical protein